MELSTFHCTGLQLDIAWEDPSANYRKVLVLLNEAAPPSGSLVVLPEMFATGFSMNVENIARSAEDTAMFLAATAAKFEICLLAGVATHGVTNRGRNEAVVFGPNGDELARYCKRHPFSFSGEDRHYEAGEGITVFEWRGWKIAPFLCYDLRFPEIFREAVRQGAQLFIVPANWPQTREMHWRTLLQARAIENQCYVAGINRCGHDPHLEYSGRSIIIDPRGEIVADAGEKEGFVSAEMDGQALLDYRAKFPVLADMRM